MEGPKSGSPVLCLDLNNFDSAGAERSRYVLTSPRSLESCARLGVRPVQLLIKSLNELIAERREVPFEAMRVIHESYEKERTKLLLKCREERERIIQAAGDRHPDTGKPSGVDTKLKDPSTYGDTMCPVTYADLCLKGKSVSRSSCSVSGKREADRSTICSFTLGDLRHTPATELQLQEVTTTISRKMCVTLSDRDCKIAALMLVKHQEEQARLRSRQQEERERQEARRQEEARRAEAEEKRRKKLRQSTKRWQKDQEARRRLRECLEKESAGRLEKEVQLQEARHRRLKEEVEAKRREKTEAAHKEAEGRKRYQEQLLREKEEVKEKEREKERQLAAEREEKAQKRKVVQEKKACRRLQEVNRRELLRHILLKQQVEQRVDEEEARMRSTLERRLRASCEKRAQVAEARLKALQEQAAEEEQQVRRVQLRAELQSLQQLTHRQTLVHLSQRRTESAALRASERRHHAARQTQQDNKRRRQCHQRLREKLQREEEAQSQLRESHVSTKEWRRERLRRQREQIQEEAHTHARASFHLRERVKQRTCGRTFDQMALEAQLAASIGNMKL